jgi:hypothetical protein
MDKGFIAWTHGRYDPGGNSINPKGKLGQNLIKLANDWINNPKTVWSKKGYWHAHSYRSKFPSFTKPGPPQPKQKMRVGHRPNMKIEKDEEYTMLSVAVIVYLFSFINRTFSFLRFCFTRSNGFKDFFWQKGSSTYFSTVLSNKYLKVSFSLHSSVALEGSSYLL